MSGLAAPGPTVRWALLGVVAGSVLSGLRVLGERAGEPGRTRDAESASAPDGAARRVPPPLEESQRVLVTVASPAGTPYRPSASVVIPMRRAEGPGGAGAAGRRAVPG